MELLNFAHPLRARSQEGGSEVQRTFFLAETAAGNNAHPGSVEEAEAVELVGLAVFLAGLLNGTSGHRDGWEEVHGTLWGNGGGGGWQGQIEKKYKQKLES